jgi:hypothetical protein
VVEGRQIALLPLVLVALVAVVLEQSIRVGVPGLLALLILEVAGVVARIYQTVATAVQESLSLKSHQRTMPHSQAV